MYHFEHSLLTPRTPHTPIKHNNSLKDVATILLVSRPNTAQMKLVSNIVRLTLASLALMTFITAIDQFQLFDRLIHDYSNHPMNTIPPDYVFTWPRPTFPPSHDKITNGSSGATATISHSNFTVKFPLCLVHVGKAGGSSISCGLGLMYADCEGMPRDTLPETYYFHIRRNTCPEKVQTYLVTLRNPITRFQSWFNFEKNIIPYRKNKQQEAKAIQQRGRLFTECYNDFETFAAIGLQPLKEPIQASKVVDMNCPERAWAAAVGARAFSYHEFYNYEHYFNWLHGHKGPASHGSVQALRSEHLQEDWATISKEELFRQVNMGNKTNTKPTLPLSNGAMQNLCHALCLEIQYYKQLLSMAENLGPTGVKTSFQELMAMCPEETEDVRECQGLPTFPKLSIQQGKYDQETKKRFYEVRS